jgi:hypothetical protein
MNDQPETKSKSWKHIESDLKSAMDSWDKLSKKYEGTVVTPEDKKLNEMRLLLEELKTKIEDLSKP